MLEKEQTHMMKRIVMIPRMNPEPKLPVGETATLAFAS